MKVLLTDHPWPQPEIETEILAQAGLELVDAPNQDESTLCSYATDVAAIATCWAPVTKRVITAAKQCRLICRMGIGLDNIDVATATQLGIPVTNVPDYCVEEVADHTLALLLSLVRNVSFFHLRTKQGEYALADGPAIARLRGRRLGLIGLGRIGQAVAVRAQSFGLEVVAHSRSGDARETGCQMVSLEEVFRTADILSLHVPLTAQTQHLINRVSIAQLKPGVFIINTSRGGLIDPTALWDGIQSGVIAGAGLDVFEPEPPDLSDLLYRDERVIATPHAAFVSSESVRELRTRVSKQIVAGLTGGVPENIVNGIQPTPPSRFEKPDCSGS